MLGLSERHRLYSRVDARQLGRVAYAVVPGAATAGVALWLLAGAPGLGAAGSTAQAIIQFVSAPVVAEEQNNTAISMGSFGIGKPVMK